MHCISICMAPQKNKTTTIALQYNYRDDINTYILYMGAWVCLMYVCFLLLCGHHSANLWQIRPQSSKGKQIIESFCVSLSSLFISSYIVYNLAHVISRNALNGVQYTMYVVYIFKYNNMYMVVVLKRWVVRVIVHMGNY